MDTLGVMAVLGTICVSFVALTGLTVGLAILGQRLFARAGGLTRLAERYPAEHEPVGETFKFQSVQIGPVRWRFCTRVVVAEEGLYIAARNTLVRQPAFRIPWHEIVGVRRATLYLQQARRYSIGEPEVGYVVVQMHIARAVAPHLAPGLDPES